MKDARYLEIKELVERFDKLSDVAFLAALAEHGVSGPEVTAYAKQREKNDRSIRLARRR